MTMTIEQTTPPPTRRASYPPGPSPLRYAWMYVQERCDFLRVARRLIRTYGDCVHVQIGSRHHYYFNHPREIEEVLMAGYKVRTSRPPTLRHVMGQGIITSQGELHRTMRGLIQPFFQKTLIQDKANVIVEENERLLTSWRPGETRDLVEEMTHLTLAVIIRALLGPVYTDPEMIKKI